MAAAQRFRSAFNGFNREDVVHYIEYLNNHYTSQIQQLNNQLAAKPAEDAQLRAQLDAALAKIAELEVKLEEQAKIQVTLNNEAELEAYRRAEKTERMARERAQQVYDMANAALADAALKADAAAAQISAAADQAFEQLKACQETVLGSKDTFRDAVASLYAIHTEEE